MNAIWYDTIGKETSYLEFLVSLAKHGYLNTKWLFVEEEDSFDHGHNAPTVVLTPWLTCTPGWIHVLWDHLKEHYNVAYAPRFDNFNTGSVSNSSKRLIEKLMEVVKVETNWDLTLIGHSLWGLINLETLKQNVMLHVHNVISLSTPYKGAPGAIMFQNILPACADINKKGGYHAKTRVWDQIEWSLIAHISMEDSVVPTNSQRPQNSIAKGNTKIVRHEGFEHASFILGETARETARIININLQSWK